MIRVVVWFENGYCSCDQTDFLEYDDDMTEAEIVEDICNMKLDYAELFAHVHFGWGESYTDEEWEDWIENSVMFNYRIVDSYEEWETLKEEYE